MALQLLYSEYPYIWGKFYFIFYQCIHNMFPILKFNWRICYFHTKKKKTLCFLETFFTCLSVWVADPPVWENIKISLQYTVVGSGKAPDCVPVHTRALSACLRAESPRAGTARQVIRHPPHPHPDSQLLSVIWDLIAQNGCFFFNIIGGALCWWQETV
jgi:hypothetical protein